MNPSSGHPNRRAHNWIVYRSIDKLLNQHLHLIRGNTYDLGCGDAHYRRFILEHADRYTGVDWSNSIHDGEIDVMADLNQTLPIGQDSADTVISLSTLEHLFEPERFLRETYRILKPGSHLLLQVPWQWQIHEAPHDYFRYSPFGLTLLLESAGFKNIAITPQAGFFTTWVLKWNYFTLRFVRGPAPLRWLIKVLLIPLWYLGQWASPLLDRLDRDWAKEAIGFVVTARKPARSIQHTT